MKRRLGLVLIGVLTFVSWGDGALVGGGKSMNQEIGPAQQLQGKIAPGVFDMKEKFRGGQRACVIAQSHNTVDLEILVFDEHKNVVVREKGDGPFAAAIWYPLRDAAYRIEIRNPANIRCSVYISVK
ncbi:MAG: hypothetical protein L0Y72_10595 [Gemmataceae bacterium]|nr:hypothetical protein [Gemmataceae bacterium]MCI0642681.1 hypothetical protein [Gemmataceae bacterium]MCI0739482.1 hypothetical protein [Gemmataceae bacterium]